MKRLQFECKLLSDVILNQSAATEGTNTTLDFIPGGNFLGIVAAHYADFAERAGEVFHSGRVRFGDAHPKAGNGDMRTLHVPAAMFYPKTGSPNEIYIHHCYKRPKENAPQLKQYRHGFYAFDSNVGTPADIPTSFAIKSSYDRELRRSEDNKMYGYESLGRGCTFQFEVEVDDDSLADEITQCLLGKHHIGRSRTAQYGFAEIRQTSFCQVESRTSTTTQTTVYADGRLIFLDADGEPTFCPTADDLGVPGGKIDWSKSQLRTFQYAPWNAKRATRDAERLGIEKGSVFVVDRGTPNGASYIGSYRNEGFGKVIYNPDFLQARDGQNGKAVYTLGEKISPSHSAQLQPLSGTPLLQFIAAARKKEQAEEFVYKQVNDFVNSNGNKFIGESFASQWGAIRTIAMQYPTYKDIVYQLFDKTKTIIHGKTNEPKKEADAYLTHGVAAEKWKKGRRTDILKKFIDGINARKNDYGDIVPMALINLASEMAKKCRQ